jgi:hypothetical protein
MMKQDNIHILLFAFLISSVVFFVYPSFFAGQGFLYFQYLPSYTDKIGVDLAQNISYSKELLNGHSPYIGNNLYPPLVSIAFIPFAILDFRTAYISLSIITFLSFASLFALAIKIVGKVTPEIILIFVTGIISYGFQFELERGQFYTITMAITMWSLYLAHFTKRKYLAWGLFTFAVQLKLFPVFFIWLIVKRNWKNLLILCSINFALLFIFGFGAFFDFLNALSKQSTQWLIPLNHSLRSYTASINRLDLFPIFALLLIAGWFYANWKSKGFDALTILYCTLTALLLPTISHDYTLPILMFPMALILQVPFAKLPLFLIALLYSSTLFSYASKIIMVNNGLALLLMSVLTLALIARRKNETRMSSM